VTGGQSDRDKVTGDKVKGDKVTRGQSDQGQSDWGQSKRGQSVRTPQQQHKSLAQWNVLQEERMVFNRGLESEQGTEEDKRLAWMKEIFPSHSLF
jgi:hypothetical protein